MSSVYISQIQLKEFRNFGDLTIDLPGGPGVMIVHGTNGLGKSSLFDGLEWALTGEIDHFNEWKKGAKPRDYLRRWGASSANPTEISLAFTGGQSLRRVLPNTLDTKAGIDDVTEFLRDGNWKQQIDSLHRYLLLTHFLGQSTLSRMTHRRPEERWEFLEQPAQSEWATELINTIHGQGNTNNAKAYDRRIDTWTDQLNLVRVLLDREASEWTDAQGQGAVDDSEASNIVASIIRTAPNLLDNRTTDSAAGIDSTVERLVAGEAAMAGFVAARSANLERARDILAQLTAQDNRDRDRALAIEASRAALDPLRLALYQHDSEKTDAGVNVQGIEDDITVVRKRLEELRVLRARSNQLDQWENDLVGMRSQASQLASEARAAKAAADQHAKRRRILQKLDNQLDELDRRQAESQQLRLKAELLAGFEQPSFYVSQLDLLQRSTTEISTLIAEFDRSLEQLHSQKQQAEQALEAARLTFDNIAGAVARIAEQLTEADCECPVCATTFGRTGELRLRAFEAVDRFAPSLVPFQEKLAEVQRLETETIRKRAEKYSEFEATSVQLTNIERDAVRRKELVGDVFGAAPETPIDSFLERLSASVESLNDRFARLTARRNLPLLAGDGDPFVIWTAAVRRQSMLEGNLTSLVKDIDVLEARVGTERSEVAAETLKLDSDVATSIADTELALATLTEKLSATREGLESVSQAAKAASLSLSQAEAALQAMLDEAQDSRKLLDALIAEWRSMEYLGDAINSEALRSQDQMLAELSAALEFVRPLIVRLREGRRIWARQSNHKETIEQLRSQLAAAPNLGRDGLREEADRVIAMCQERISAIRKAKEIAQNATTEVNRKVQEFNSDFLRPLSALMNKINRAILSEPDIGLDLKVEKKKIAQTAIKSADAPEIVSKLNPQLVHSEGQMAALAVSMLCAANLSFPWCRWPALVMDDPLQHNDVIHAAAFADIMCNLVEARKQQIFLSTHDIAQAEFLRRKFGSRNIPCTSVHLLGRGRDGLEVQVKNYDGGSDAATAAVNS